MMSSLSRTEKTSCSCAKASGRIVVVAASVARMSESAFIADAVEFVLARVVKSVYL